jgi:threonine dehydrogenase-like Zn-dependent dehydrogenase
MERLSNSLSTVIAAKQLGAERLIAMSRHKNRQNLAREFGATDIVSERGDEGVELIKDLTLPLEQVAEGYRAMDERRAIKTLLWP